MLEQNIACVKTLFNYKPLKESLKKIPTEGTPPLGPGPTSGQLALNLQLNPLKEVKHAAHFIIDNFQNF